MATIAPLVCLAFLGFYYFRGDEIDMNLLLTFGAISVAAVIVLLSRMIRVFTIFNENLFLAMEI
jgi:ABC-type proline/glycine betaine transport system permease subunit